MEMKTVNKIKDMICQKMEEIARSNTLSNSDIEKLNMLIVGYEKLLKTEEMEGYSQRGYSRDGGSYGGSYGNSYGGNSNAGSYEGGNSYRRGGSSYGNSYSRAEGSDMTRDHIQRMMSSGNVSEADRRVLERAMEII